MSGSRRLTREELLEIASRQAMDALQNAEMRTLMGLDPFDQTTSSTAPPLRTFVCQGCGKAQSVRAARLVCGCGTTSAAEVMT